jgi:hypothetical protein
VHVEGGAARQIGRRERQRIEVRIGRAELEAKRLADARA